MKVFQNRAVAAVLMVLAIAASVAIGQAKKPDLSVEPSTKVVGSCCGWWMNTGWSISTP